MCIYCLLRPQDKSVHGETNRAETKVNVVSKHLSQETGFGGVVYGEVTPRIFLE
jgi:hypothetical protein